MAMTTSRRFKAPAAFAISVPGGALGALLLHNRGEPTVAVWILGAWGTAASLCIYAFVPMLEERGRKTHIKLLLVALLFISILLFVVT